MRPVTVPSLGPAALLAGLAAFLAVGCTASTSHPAASPVAHPAASPTPQATAPAAPQATASAAQLPPDQRSKPALLKIATQFNHDYDTGDYGPVYARWDARSQAIITGADYIQRHKGCPSGSHATSQTESASPGGPHGAWLVHYEIGGQQLTDYWFYRHHRWVFDLILSNPDAVRLYRMPPAQYAAAVGCAH